MREAVIIKPRCVLRELELWSRSRCGFAIASRSGATTRSQILRERPYRVSLKRDEIDLERRVVESIFWKGSILC